MKIHRPWLSLLIDCTLLALGTAVAFAMVLAGASIALAGHNSGQAHAQTVVSPAPTPPDGLTFSGMVTDSRCGARHIRNSQQNSIECVKACVRKGATYVLVDGDRTYTLLGNESALAAVAGERAHITGTRQGDMISVDAAVPAL